MPGGFVAGTVPVPSNTPRPTPPTQAAGFTAVPLATQPPATARPAPTSTPMPPSPTPDPHRIVVTEADIVQAVASGAAGQSGLTVEGLAVRFTGGKMRLAASRLSYSFIQVSNLVIVGRLVAQDGVLRLEPESIAPSGLVTSMIPTVANQALAQYAGQWYVEEVRTLEGRIELRIR